MPNLHTLNPSPGFTALQNASIDDLPDLPSIGYLAVLLRHEESWVPSIDDLVGKMEGQSRGGATKARKTVMQYGYYVSVRYQHSHRKQFATDIWRLNRPHTDEDLDVIASYYRTGSTTQIPVLGKNKRPKLDSRKNVIYQQVTVLWARVDSWRGEEVVGGHADAGTEPDEPGPVDNSDPTDPDPVDNSPHRGAHSGDSVRPAETGVSPGATESPVAEGSVGRGVGGWGVYEKTEEKTPQKTTEENSPSPVVPSSVPDARGDDRDEGEGENPFGEDELARKRAEETARSLLNTLVRDVPADLVSRLSEGEKAELVRLVAAAHHLGVSNAVIRSSLTNVAGTKVLGRAWGAKLQTLIEHAAEVEQRKSLRAAELPACATCRCEEGDPSTWRRVLEDPLDVESREVPCPSCRRQSPGAHSDGLTAS